MGVFKNVWAVVLGTIVAMLLITTGEYALEHFFPFPQGLDFKDHKAVIDAIAHMSTNAHLFLLLNYAVAAFAGGTAATFMSKRTAIRPVIVVGALLTIGGILNDIQIPHPMLFAVLNVVVFLPVTLAAYLIFRKKTDSPVNN